MNGELERLLRCLPQPPAFAYDWSGLARTPLGPLIEAMAATPQNPAWHGEGDVWTHTRLVCESLAAMPAFRALDERQRRALSLAALLHDAGKPRRTRLEDGVPVSPGHGAVGERLVRRMLWQDFGLCGEPAARRLRETVCLLIRSHGLPLHMLDRDDPLLCARRIAADGALAPDFTLRMLCMLAEADVLGRVADDRDELLEAVRMCAELAEEAGCLDGSYRFPSAHTARAYLSGRKVWAEQELYDDSWGEVILLCGLPGTGKDTWLQNAHPGLPVISLDAIRAELGARATGDQGRVVQLARERAREHLRRHEPFVWNATSLTADLRKRQIDLFEQYHAAVRIVFLETEWDENLRRNAARSDAVPEHVINDMLGKLAPPGRAEARFVDWICV